MFNDANGLQDSMMFKVSPVCMKMVNCLMNQQTLDFSQCHRQNMNMRPSEHPVVMCLGLPCSSCSVSSLGASGEKKHVKGLQRPDAGNSAR